MRRALSGLRLLLALTTILVVAPNSTAADEVWAGPASEHDQYTPNNPIYAVRPSCDSTVGYATLVHTQATWRFLAENDCLGFDVNYRDDECTTDADGTLRCSRTTQVAIITLAFTSAGHVTVEYQSTFWGDHYLVEGDLSRL